MKRLVLILFASWMFSAYVGTFLLMLTVGGFSRTVAMIFAHPIRAMILPPIWPVWVIPDIRNRQEPVYAICAWLFYAGSGILCQYCLSRRYRKIHPTGFCSNCGYDLRATPDPRGPLLMRCPECGTSFGKNNSEL